MDPRETRRIYAITKDGAYTHCSWGLHPTWAEAVADPSVTPARRSWAAALGPDQLTADGWAAIPTTWRRVPRLLGAHRELPTPPVVTPDDVLVAGCRYSLTKPCRPHHMHTPASPREPHAPDATVEDEEALLAAAEHVGRALDVVEELPGRVLTDAELDALEEIGLGRERARIQAARPRERNVRAQPSSEAPMRVDVEIRRGAGGRAARFDRNTPRPA